ncbi:GT99 family glycosyltransferase N-terminal domain-containing protein [Aeromonas hydrophila]|uniref:GT99 family glycosyltransferase N-terminal domain-containing protein n=1 Tax=Aeromonas hydrophila TaxID=644 RepID=UPI002F41ECFC
MLAAFLPPYPFRAVPAPYLWCYYRLLGEWATESCMFITGRDYVRPIELWEDRWECTDDAATRLDYSLPKNTQPSQHHYAWLDEGYFDDWLRIHNHNPLAVFRHFLCERDDVYEEELHTILCSAPSKIEAVITFLNVPSLSAVCQRLGIPVIHQELGPLRGHIYRDTAYVDFQGVNGNSEVEYREREFRGWSLNGLKLADLLMFFLKDPSFIHCLPGKTSEIGIVLQVEDDSNLVAFGNGMDNQSIILAARSQVATSNLLIRPHPGSLFTLREGSMPIDESATSLEFVSRCKKLMTINSSVALEALFLGVPVTIFGDSSLCHLATESPHSASLIRRLAFYLFAYLVPRSCQLAPNYLRFRLGEPDEKAIIEYHLDCYMRDDDMTLPTESDSEDLQTRLLAQVWASNQFRSEHNKRLQALTDHVSMLSRELSDVNRRLVEEREAHGHVIQVVEQITEQLNNLTKQHSDTLDELRLREKEAEGCNEIVNKICSNGILRFYIDHFILKL